jgi:hypothetical protein
MGSLVKFYSTVVQIALILALAGQLKGCTLGMLGLAAQKTQHGIISYSKFTHELLRKP